MLSILPAICFDQLVGRKGVQFDYARFVWIGSTDRSNKLLIMRADTPYRTMQDVRSASQLPKCAATGCYMPKLLQEVIGTKFDVVLGYPGGPEMDLAVERGEAQCRAFTLTAFLSNREPYLSWRKNGFVPGPRSDGIKAGYPSINPKAKGQPMTVLISHMK